MGKYINDLVLPLGNEAAAFAKVAAADYMGREMAKEAARVVRIGRLTEAIGKRKKVLGKLTNKKDIAMEEKNISRLESVLGEARGVNKKKPKTDAAKRRMMNQATSPISKKEQIMKNNLGGRRTKQRKRISEVNKQVNPAKNTPKSPASSGAAAPGEKGKGVFDDAEWYKSKRIWTGAGIGAGGALLGSAALGD